MAFLNVLMERFGYFCNDELNDMMELFGEDFPVVCKSTHDERYILPLNKIESSEERLGPFRECFLWSRDFRKVKEVLDNYNDEDIILNKLKNLRAL